MQTMVIFCVAVDKLNPVKTNLVIYFRLGNFYCSFLRNFVVYFKEDKLNSIYLYSVIENKTDQNKCKWERKCLWHLSLDLKSLLTICYNNKLFEIQSIENFSFCFSFQAIFHWNLCIAWYGSVWMCYFVQLV